MNTSPIRSNQGFFSPPTPPSSVISQEDFEVQAVAKNRISTSNAELINDFKTALALVKQNGLNIQFITPRLRNDLEIAIAAVEENVLACQFMGKYPLTFWSIVKKIVIKNGLLLQFVPLELRESFSIVETAYEQNPRSLIYAGPNVLKKIFEADPNLVEKVKAWRQEINTSRLN